MIPTIRRSRTRSTRPRFAPDDAAVSPVIGVVLLVAIAVVTATTVGAFVLGLGPGEQPPRADLVFAQEDDGDTNVTVAVASAEALFEEDVVVYVDGEERDVWDGAGPIEVGDEVVVEDVDDGATVQVVWIGADGSRSETLGRYEVV